MCGFGDEIQKDGRCMCLIKVVMHFCFVVKQNLILEKKGVVNMVHMSGHLEIALIYLRH